jgi:hypothetical protein
MMFHTLEDLRTDGRIMTYLKWIFEKYVVKMLTGVSWVKDPVAGFCDHAMNLPIP